MQNKPESKEQEIIVRTTYRDGQEITVIERKSQPVKYDGIDI